MEALLTRQLCSGSKFGQTLGTATAFTVRNCTVRWEMHLDVPDPIFRPVFRMLLVEVV